MDSVVIASALLIGMMIAVVFVCYMWRADHERMMDFERFLISACQVSGIVGDECQSLSEQFAKELPRRIQYYIEDRELAFDRGNDLINKQREHVEQIKSLTLEVEKLKRELADLQSIKDESAKAYCESVEQWQAEKEDFIQRLQASRNALQTAIDDAMTRGKVCANQYAQIEGLTAEIDRIVSGLNENLAARRPTPWKSFIPKLLEAKT